MNTSKLLKFTKVKAGHYTYGVIVSVRKEGYVWKLSRNGKPLGTFKTMRSAIAAYSSM